MYVICWWADASEDGPGIDEQEETFASEAIASDFAWEKLEEGFIVRLWRR
jgi:hypothetical protein